MMLLVVRELIPTLVLLVETDCGHGITKMSITFFVERI